MSGMSSNPAGYPKPVGGTHDPLSASRTTLLSARTISAPTYKTATVGSPVSMTMPSQVKTYTMPAGLPAGLPTAMSAGVPAAMQATKFVTAAMPNAVTVAPAGQPVPQALMTRTVAAAPVGTVSSARPMTTTTAAAAPQVTYSMPKPATAVVAGPVDGGYVAALEKRLADLEVAHACKTHSAFVFIKPHAVNDKVKKLVKEHLMSKGIYVLSEGSIPAEEIDQRQLIDVHYGAIAAKAVRNAPSELNVQQKAMDEFQTLFGLSWADALSQGIVFNASDAAQHLGITPSELGAKWGKLRKGHDLLKFGGGFYCGKIGSIYAINGFYMDMRAKFTTPGTCIYYFETEWDPRQLSWASFRGDVLGGTDPANAARGSVRHMIYNDWRRLGLEKCPDTGDNGVHASASPFEALAERANWMDVPITEDFYGRAMLASGVSLPMIEAWCNDPPVSYEGGQHSLFDLVEDLDARECLHKCAFIAAANM